MMAPENVSLSLAFAAGVLSFASPCILPLVPSYLSYLTGLSYEEIRESGEAARVRSVILVNSLFFVAGFSLVFIVLGASVSFVGKILFEYQDQVRLLGGIMITMFGLYVGDRAFDFKGQRFFSEKSTGVSGAFAALIFMAGLAGLQMGYPTLGGVLTAAALYVFVAVFLPVLSSENRIMLKSKPAGWLGSMLVGVTFAAGWTPCVGPILGSILLFAGTQQTAGQGVVLLASYSAGLGVPFLLSGLGVGYFFRFYQSFRRYFHGVEIASSAMLLLVGVLLISNYLNAISSYLIFWTGFVGI